MASDKTSSKSQQRRVPLASRSHKTLSFINNTWRRFLFLLGYCLSIRSEFFHRSLTKKVTTTTTSSWEPLLFGNNLWFWISLCLRIYVRCFLISKWRRVIACLRIICGCKTKTTFLETQKDPIRADRIDIRVESSHGFCCCSNIFHNFRRLHVHGHSAVPFSHTVGTFAIN